VVHFERAVAEHPLLHCKPSAYIQKELKISYYQYNNKIISNKSSQHLGRLENFAFEECFILTLQKERLRM
jgi:hypothetical protein